MSTDPIRRMVRATAHELRLLRRQGVVAATAVTAAAWAVVLRLLPPDARPVGLELVTFAQLAVVGYSFAGAAVLLGKAEGTLLALAASPLRLAEQLTARVLSLSCLAAAATLVVVLAAGVPVDWTFPAGALAAAVVALVLSLVVVAPHRSVSRWLLPSVPPLLLLALPAVAYLGGDGAWLWLLPSQGALILLRGPGGAIEVAGALLATVVWSAVLGVLAQRRFSRFVATADA